ncbi:MAG: peptidoglycan DD-metalloendopeptidase family protein [bacterium]|nr:peptidoglycan DD-metalloendopeptidase family protein [bacterium]
MYRRVFGVIILLILIVPFAVPHLGFSSTDNTLSDTDVTVLELNDQIKDKKASVSTLRTRIQTYEQNITKKRQEASTLENVLAITEDEIEKVTLDLEASKQEVEQLDLEIQQTDLEIGKREEQVSVLKGQLAEFIRQVYVEDQKDLVEILLTNDSLSEFFDQVRYLEESQGELGKGIARLKVLRSELNVQKMGLENNKKRQIELRDQLSKDKDQLEEQRTAKQALVVQSILSAEKYDQLLSEARSEQARIDADISNLERTKQDKLKILSTGNAVSMMWPVDPTRGISTYFKDPEYPFRYLFEHGAIDIRAYQGTPIRAVEDGYVARTHMNGKAYAYIMLLHDKGLASVYGHVSAMTVKQDTYVKKGTIIGYSGGTPRTTGSGPYTTGPHLHFEIRLNGIPVDPLNYLP